MTPRQPLGISGEIETFLGALQHSNPSSAILAATQLVGPRYDQESFDNETYWSFLPAGTDFLFREGILISVMIRLRPNPEEPEYGVYPTPGDLIDGLGPELSRRDVEAQLGAPEKSAARWARYRVGERFLHFAYGDDENVSMVTAMSYAP